MTEQVKGYLGKDDILLENAATEATLKKLLEETIKMSKEHSSSLSSLLGRTDVPRDDYSDESSGMNILGKTVRAVGFTFGVLAGTSEKLGGAFKGVIGFADALANNGGKASNVFASLGGLPFGIGSVMQAFSALQKIQEEQLESYQKMTASGVGFSGNLDQMRLTAGRLNLTLPQFTELMSRNGEYLAKFGGNVLDGSKAFVRISSDLNNGPTGRALRGLGYTSEQISDHLIKYIAISGGRTESELKNTKLITAQTAGYLNELDRLAEVTGKSREEQEKALQTQAMEANWQLFLANLSDKDPNAGARLTKGLGDFTSLFGQAGADILKAGSQGIQVQTEEGQAFAKVSSRAYADMLRYGEAAKNGTMSSGELAKLQNKIRQEFSEDAAKFGTGVGAAAQVFAKIQEAGLQAARDHGKSSAQLDAVDARIKEEQINRGKSQAASQADQQVAMIKMANDVMAALLSLSRQLQPIMTQILGYFQTFIKSLSDYVVHHPNTIKDLGDQLSKLKDNIVYIKDILKNTFINIDSTLKSLGISWGTAIGGVILGIIALQKGLAGMVFGGVKGLISGGGGGAAGGAAEGAAGGTAGGVLKGLGAGFASAASWLFKGIAIGASLYAIGWGMEKLGTGLLPFQQLDWETIGKGLVAMTGLGALGAAAGALSELILPGALAIGALGLALQTFPSGILGELGDLFSKVSHAIGDLFVSTLNAVVEGLTNLSNINPAGLLGVAAGVTTLGGAFAVFGVGTFLTALTNYESLTNGLSKLTTIDPSNLENIGKGIKNFVKNLPGAVDSLSSYWGGIGSTLDSIGDGMIKISQSSPNNLILLTKFIQTVSAAKIGSSGIIIFNDNTVKLLDTFSKLPLKPNVDQVEKLKMLALTNMDAATRNLNNFGTSLDKLIKIDTTKMDILSESITKLKTAITPDKQEQNIARQGINYIVGLLGGTTSDMGPGTGSDTNDTSKYLNTNIGIPEGASAQEIIEKELQILNSNIARLVNLNVDIKDNTKRTVDNMNTNLFRR